MPDTNKRVIIIGLDGMPYRLIRHLAAEGVMPNTGMLARDGVLTQMASSIPAISSVAWSSVITGVNPGEHGIFGFTDVASGTYRMTFPNFQNLKAPPFWKTGANGRSVIINVPSTFPAAELDGVLIAGFVALDLRRSTYPSWLVPKLADMGYQVDVDSGKAGRSLDLFLKDLDRTLEARIRAYRYLWAEEDWQTFMLVFTGTDRLAHFLWDAYEDASHKYHEAFLEHLNRIDQVVGETVARMNDGDALIMLSDHGFDSVDLEMHVNYFLAQEGFLKLRRTPAQSLADIDQETKAFALDPARIYVNLAGKYPRGSVPVEEREVVLGEVTGRLRSLQVEGRAVVAAIHRKEDIYHGPFLEQAPDLVVEPAKGIDLKAGLTASALTGKGPFTGKHTREDAFLLVAGPAGRTAVPANPCVSDVVGILDRLRDGHSVR